MTAGRSRAGSAEEVAIPVGGWESGWRLRREYVLAYAAQIVSWGSALAFNLVVPLQLGSTIFGELVLVVGLAYFAVGLFDQGFNMAAVRILAGRGDRGVMGVLLGGKLLATLALAAALAALAPVLGRVYRLPEGTLLFLLSAGLTVVLGQLSLLDSFIISQAFNWGSLAGRLVIAAGLMGLPWGLARLSGGSSGAAVGALLTYAVGAVVFWGVLRWPSLIPRWKEGAGIWGRAARDTGQFVAIFLASAFFAWGVVIVAGVFLTTAEVANLKVALALVTGVGGLVPLPGMMIYSSFLGLAEAGKSRALRQHFRAVVAVALGIGGVGALAVAFLGPRVVAALYGAQFGEAGTLLVWVAPAVILQALDQPLLGYLVAQDVPLHRLGLRYLAGTALAVLATFTLTARLGLLGAGVAYILGRLLLLAILLPFILRLRAWRVASGPSTP